MKKRISLIVVAALCAALFCGCAASQPASQTAAPDYLVLVNQTHPVSPDFIGTVTLCEAPDADGGAPLQVEKATLAAFGELAAALAEQGIEIGIDGAYRSVERQRELMTEYSELYGEEYAKSTVAEPGTSEHHTGLAVDIVPKVNGEWVFENEKMLKETELFAVIHKMLPAYGFILRYPDGKTDITGYAYEPWHLRYVGKEAAAAITAADLTLDEYLADGAEA